MNKFLSVFRKKKRKIIGLMSGTSCDGVDLALIEINASATHFELVVSYHKPYNKTQKNTILDCLDLKKSNIEDISQINFYLAQIWADAIKEMLTKWRKENSLYIATR